LKDDTVGGYEALARIDHPEICLAPDQWLMLAESLGLRDQLELSMLAAAARLGTPPADARLFVNVSGSVLLHSAVEGHLAALPPHVLEITEHERIDDYQQVQGRLAHLRAQGSLIAVDDVGSGYASLSHVLALDPSYLKIDRSIVSFLDRDPRRRALVAALHTLAAESGARSIAEGVERAEELSVLRRIGVDFAQGYLLCRPAAPWPTPEHRRRDSKARSTAKTVRRKIVQAPDARQAARTIVDALSKDSALLPSVYLVRGAHLRCVARFGQWLVLDGIPRGVGITGTAWETGEVVFVPDVQLDKRYRQAIPGVRSEVAFPLRVDGTVVGVLNVDARRSLAEQDVALIEDMVVALQDRLRVVGTGLDTDSVLQRLAQVAPRLLAAETTEKLAHSLVDVSLSLTDFDSACVWLMDKDGRPQSIAAGGVHGQALAELTAPAVSGIQALLRHMASCYTNGPAFDIASGPTDVLRDLGIRATIMVPLREQGQLCGFFLLTRQRGSRTAPESVDLAELLCAQAASRLSALQRLSELEALATKDSVTGLANRAHLETLLQRQSTRLPARWVLIVDIDRFKGVNDNFGHEVGDRLLAGFGRQLRRLAGCAEAARLGGDEFVAIFAANDGPDAVRSTEEFYSLVAPLLRQYGADASIGLADTRNVPDLRAALLLADQALYKRKALGGAGITLWTGSSNSEVPAQRGSTSQGTAPPPGARPTAAPGAP
jgi:diguanylate cyclase (GGDEF)-like protein